MGHRGDSRLVCLVYAAGCLWLALAGACSKPEPAEVTDTREPIAIKYVASPELPVHRWARDDSPVIAKYLNGESVSILAQKGDWCEVRTAGTSGFVHAADLTDAAAAKQESENPSPKFEKLPSPIAAPGAHGTIYIEANVNTEGEVTSTKVITNTTGQPDLATRNEEALKRGKFYPIVVKGNRQPFVYYYRVDY